MPSGCTRGKMNNSRFYSGMQVGHQKRDRPRPLIPSSRHGPEPRWGLSLLRELCLRGNAKDPARSPQAGSPCGLEGSHPTAGLALSALPKGGHSNSPPMAQG